MRATHSVPLRRYLFHLPVDAGSRTALNGKHPMCPELKTRESLLSRLRKTGEDGDWQSFYDQYRHVILSFCRRQGLDEFSAHDVLQETVILLMRKLPEFRYDPAQGKFRNWLLKLVARKISDARKRARRARLVFVEESSGQMREACSDEAGVTESVENAWRQALMEEALRRIKSDPRTRPETFLIFQNYVLNGASVSEVARTFEVEENVVYQIKNRMLRRLTAEVEMLEENRHRTVPNYGRQN